MNYLDAQHTWVKVNRVKPAYTRVRLAKLPEIGDHTRTDAVLALRHNLPTDYYTKLQSLEGRVYEISDCILCVFEAYVIWLPYFCLEVIK